MPSFTQSFNLAAQTRFGTSAPATAPVGWSVAYFEDFLSWNISGTDGNGNPLATTNENPTKQWQLVPLPGTYNINRNLEQEWFCSPQKTPGINPYSQSGTLLTITAATATNPTVLSTLSGNTSLINLYNSYISQGMQNPPFSSGGINTSIFLNVQYGYFELNCKQPAGNGMWTAFWMKQGGEFDIFESVGRFPTRMGFTSHYNDGSSIGNAGSNFAPDLGFNTTQGFHTYGGLWTPNYLAWYVDGLLKQQNPLVNNGSDGFTTNPMYIIINFALGTGMGDPRATASELPQSFVLDWVRYSSLGPQ